MPQTNDKIIRFLVKGNTANVVLTTPLDNIIDDVLDAKTLSDHLKANKPLTLAPSASGTYLVLSIDDKALCYVAEYGKTTYADLVANKGKPLAIKDGNLIAPVSTYFEEYYAKMYAYVDKDIYIYQLNVNNEWSKTMLDNASVVKAIPNQTTFNEIKNADYAYLEGTENWIYSLSEKQYDYIRFVNVENDMRHIWTVSKDNVWTLTNEALCDNKQDKLNADNLAEHLKVQEPITLTKSASGTYLTMGFDETALEGINSEIARAKTEVAAGSNIEVAETKAPDGHTIYTISGTGTSNNVNLISSDGSININKTSIGDTETFDLSTLHEGLAKWGVFEKYNGTWTAESTNNTLTCDSGKGIKVEIGHTYFLSISASGDNSIIRPGDTLGGPQIKDYSGARTYTTAIDCSFSQLAIGSTVIYTATSDYIDIEPGFSYFTNAQIVVNIFEIQPSISSGGEGANDKVAVDGTSDAGFLEQVLVSSSDVISLVKQNGQLRIQYNSDLTSDPKLSTIDESQINSAGPNYGGYSLKDGYTSLVWNDTTNTSYDWVNALVSQYMRISAAQGTITKCNVVLAGTLSGDKPCFNIGIFSTSGVLLGQSGLVEKGNGFSSGTELVTTDMKEEYPGSLNIARNTRYIIQVWSAGIQLAAMSFNDNLNYAYNYELRQNLTATVSQPVFLDPNSSSFQGATYVDFISFGAAPIL